MIQFSTNGTLPSGIHLLTLPHIELYLVFNTHRREQFAGMKRAFEPLQQSGCHRIYIGGSFATSKEFRGDFDVCWDDDNVDFVKLKELDPVLLDFKNNRAAQKAKYGGELFPASFDAIGDGTTYLEFFQQDRDGNSKGIIAIDLSITS
jgi:hypothetical protein